MRIAFVRRYLDRRAAIRREADALIAEFGTESWVEARRRAFAHDDDAHAAQAWQVVHRIERKLRIRWQPDTATRYLDHS